MDVLVITGSPRKVGTSALLADEFIDEIRLNGSCVTRFDAAFADLHPCNACNYCVRHNKQCYYQDDMEILKPAIYKADVIAIVTPLYYFGMPAQIKTAIDRLYSTNDELKTPKKAVLLATAGLKEEWITDGLVAHYRTLCRYFKWTDAGMVLAFGVQERKDIEMSEYPAKVRSLAAAL